MGRLLVFSDYDGTISDERTDTCEISMRCIRVLREARIPLVIVSSKTCEELHEVSRRLELNAPFVFENGAGIAYPSEHGYRIEAVGLSVRKLRKLVPYIESVIEGKIETLERMDVPQLCAYTGLSYAHARRAKKRRFSLPFIIKTGSISKEKIETLSSALAEKGFLLRWGGKFYHLVARGAGKGEAVKRVCEFYLTDANGTIVTAGIGNSENDFDMLRVVDHPYLVRNGSSNIDYTDVPCSVTKKHGQEGFCEAVRELLSLARIDDV